MRIIKIVFLQNTDDFYGFGKDPARYFFVEEPREAFFEADEEEQVAFMAVHDDPQSYDESNTAHINSSDVDDLDVVRKCIGAGASDQVFRVGDYYLTRNARYGYAGLAKLLEDEVTL